MKNPKGLFLWLIIILIILGGCSQAINITATPAATKPVVHTNTSTPQNTPVNKPVNISEINLNNLPTTVIDFNMEVVAEGLYVPWSIVFTSANRMLVTERNGYIREIVDHQLNPKPLIFIKSVKSQDEAGLMGMALDPQYGQNKLLYVCYASEKSGKLVNRVVKLKDLGSSMEEVGIVIDDIPSAHYHAGGRIRFGPDGKLYITTGDALQKEIAQDLNSLAGKILRINSDGTIPADNPFKDSPIYSLGNRNSEGLAWSPVNQFLYQTEHGPTGFDGPPGGDEINLVIAGGNYGWPLVSHMGKREGTLPPLVEFTPAVAPASGMFYRSNIFQQFTDNYFFGGLEGEGIFRLVISAENPEVITLIEKLPIEVGRVREVVEGPDGLIYFTTSNRDGRGTMRAGDDKIYRISPK